MTLSERLYTELKNRNLHISFAESCTGGLAASGLIAVPGSSDVIEASYITYSDRIKIEELSVREKTIKKHTAVSKHTAKEMAKGARVKASSDIGVSITGYAGPQGDPVGLCYFGISTRYGETVYCINFKGERNEIRHRAADISHLLALKVVEELF